jgi:hypothetical protein
MFSNLFNFGFQRSGKQAVGFYIFYLIIFLIVGAIANVAASVFIVGANTGSQGVATNQLIVFATYSSTAISIVLLLIIGLSQLSAKKIFNSGKGWVVFILSLLFYYFSPLLGLIGLAFLSTMPKRDVGMASPAPAQIPPAPPAN